MKMTSDQEEALHSELHARRELRDLARRRLLAAERHTATIRRQVDAHDMAARALAGAFVSGHLNYDCGNGRATHRETVRLRLSCEELIEVWIDQGVVKLECDGMEVNDVPDVPVKEI